jgi:imidazolonepropionase-like amidohydrolase
MAWEKKFVRMGGTLMAGTDPTNDGRIIAGYSDRHALDLLVEAGSSFPEAIKICSLNAAVYEGIANETGTVAAGKSADLVLIGETRKRTSALCAIPRSYLRTAWVLIRKRSSTR